MLQSSRRKPEINVARGLTTDQVGSTNKSTGGTVTDKFATVRKIRKVITVGTVKNVAVASKVTAESIFEQVSQVDYESNIMKKGDVFIPANIGGSSFARSVSKPNKSKTDFSNLTPTEDID